MNHSRASSSSSTVVVNRKRSPVMVGGRLLALAGLISFIINVHLLLLGQAAAQPQGNAGDTTTTDVGRPTTATGRPERVTILAPKYIRPQSDYHVLVSVANSRTAATVDLQLTGGRDSDRELSEAKSVLVEPGETQTVKFSLGPAWPAAEYVLNVSVEAVDRSWNFSQETSLVHLVRSYLGLIQLDKPIYKPGQLVQFRALFLDPLTLAPLPKSVNSTTTTIKDDINVTISDPARNLVKAWTGLSPYRGLLTLEMPLSEEPMLGDYEITVTTGGGGIRNVGSEQQFSKSFSVAEYVLPTFDVQLHLPPYATYNHSQVLVGVKAAYTYGKPVGGHVTLTVQPLVRFHRLDTRPLHQAQYRARLSPATGSADFQLNLVKDLRLEQLQPPPSGQLDQLDQLDQQQRLGQGRDLFEREIEFFALVEEDLTGRVYNRTGILKIHDKNVKIELLNKQQTFKPGLSHSIQLKVAYQDDVPVENDGSPLELRFGPHLGRLESVKLRPVNGLVEHQFETPARVALDPDGGPDSPQVPPNTIHLQAIYRNQVHYLSPIAAFHSASGQYLQIHLPQLQGRLPKGRGGGGRASVSVNDQLRVQLKATERVQQVSCQGLARGDLVWAWNSPLAAATPQNTTTSSSGSEFEFQVTLSERMAPEARILCFYVRPAEAGADNSELIADSVSFAVNGLMRNFVKLSASRQEAKPGQELQLEVATKPNSLVGVLALDQSVLLLKPTGAGGATSHDLDQKQLGREIRGSYRPAGEEGDSISEDINTQMLLDSADMVILTNNLVYDGFGQRTGRLLYSQGVVGRVPTNRLTSASSSSIRLDSLILNDQQLSPPEFHLEKRARQQAAVLRSHFPETWLWLNGTADSSGRLQVSSKVPDTITSWQVSAFSLNEAYGLGLAPIGQAPLSVRVFRPFFVKLNLPYSIIRGETISLQAVVFNYNKRPTTAKVTLDNSKGEFRFLDTLDRPDNENEDQTTVKNRKKSNESQSRLVRIPAGEGVSVSFLVEPLKLGQLDVRLVAQGDEAQDAVLRKLLVKPEGQVQHFNKALLLDLKPGGRFKRNVTIEVPANAVAGSRKVFVSLIGDLMGSGLSNIDDLLRLPYGCGEQNMINLVPNIVLMNYLQSTGRLKEVYRLRALKNIQTGYQRQLNYKRPDGSFSAFGPSDANGSVWLTAYVLKSLQQVRGEVSVDPNVISGAANFLAQHSTAADGSFQEVGMLHHKELASQALGRPTYLTAYALIALLQGPIKSPDTGRGDHSSESTSSSSSSKLVSPLSSAPKFQDVIDRGLKYLESQLAEWSKRPASEVGDNGELSTYELSIMTYALHLANRQEAAPVQWAYERLWALASGNEQEDLTWWSAGTRRPPARSSDGDQIEGEQAGGRAAKLNSGDGQQQQQRPTTPPLKPLSVDASTKQSAHLYTPDSLSVETSALVLLTLVRRGELERALPVVRWLISQQNSRGGFASTQDTVLAIEALAAFASAHRSTTAGRQMLPSIDMDVRYGRGSSTSAASIRSTDVEQLLVRPANALVQQTLRLPETFDGAWLQLEAQGEGSAVVQVSWQYNLLVSAERPAFYLNPQLDKSSNQNYLQLSICTYYKGDPNQADTTSSSSSNMAVVEVDLPSGYVADGEALQGLVGGNNIKRVDTADGETRVLVYLDKVGRDELCFTVPAHRSTKVANNKPVPVTIYDYYDRKKAARIFYEAQPTSACDICDRDSCPATCQSSRSARLIERPISLHEQRHQKLIEQQQQQQQVKPPPATPTTTGSSPIYDRQDAVRLLPLAPVYAKLVSVVSGLRGGANS